jgi:hypothetical protein
LGTLDTTNPAQLQAPQPHFHFFTKKMKKGELLNTDQQLETLSQNIFNLLEDHFLATQLVKPKERPKRKSEDNKDKPRKKTTPRSLFII